VSLAVVKHTYEKLGRSDPMCAVLSDKRFRHNQWDPEAFYRTGKKEIRNVLEYVDRLGLRLRGGEALDFGCGVGRLSRALADHFQRVVGVDISESMVREARRHDGHGGRIEYLVNATDDLQILDDDRLSQGNGYGLGYEAHCEIGSTPCLRYDQVYRFGRVVLCNRHACA